MPNQANIAALANLLSQVGVDSDMGMSQADACHFFAKELAKLGVLVPAAMTDDELDSLAGAMEPIAEGYAGTGGQEDGFDVFRAALERIARGDPT